MAKRTPMIEKRTPRVTAARPVMADARFRPTTIIDRVLGLHGCDHAKVRESIDVFFRHVLGVLDSPAPVEARIQLLEFRK